MSEISVIIPVYNDPQNLVRCLDSLDLSTMRDFQLIIVDDGSDVSCESLVENRCERFLRLDRNGGQAAARNRGAELATSDRLFFLDADIMVEPDTLERIIEVFQNNPGISALFCSFQHDTPARNFFSQFKNLQHHFTHQVSRRDAATFCGGFGAIRRPVFEEIGGFQESLRFMEDVELGYRLHKAGHLILLCPDIQVTHNKVYSLRSLIRSDVFQRAIPWTRIMLERRVYRNDLNTSSHHVASVVVVYLMLSALFVLPVSLWGWLLVEGILLGTLAMLNRPFLAYVRKMRSNGFALSTLAMLCLQYFYSGLGLAAGLFGHIRSRTKGAGRG